VRLEPPDARLPGRRLAQPRRCRVTWRVTWPAGHGLGSLLASAWLEDQSTTPALSTRVPVRARRPAGTAFDVQTRRAVRALVPRRILPGRARSARLALRVPARPAAADRMACAGPSPRVPPPAGAAVIMPVVPVARGTRNRARVVLAAGATAAVRAARLALPAPAAAVGRAASAGPAATGTGVTPTVRVDPMTRGARASPAWPAPVPVARTTPAGMGVGAGATSAA
jgi:hypothetical protein